MATPSSIFILFVAPTDELAIMENDLYGVNVSVSEGVSGCVCVCVSAEDWCVRHVAIFIICCRFSASRIGHKIRSHHLYTYPPTCREHGNTWAECRKHFS